MTGELAGWELGQLEVGQGKFLEVDFTAPTKEPENPLLPLGFLQLVKSQDMTSFWFSNKSGLVYRGPAIGFNRLSRRLGGLIETIYDERMKKQGKLDRPFFAGPTLFRWTIYGMHFYYTTDSRGNGLSYSIFMTDILDGGFLFGTYDLEDPTNWS